MRHAGIAASMSVGLLGVAANAAVIVPNGNFETGTFADWGTPTSAVTIVSDNGPSGAGSYAMRFQGGAWNAGANQGNTKITNAQGLQPLTAYTASFDIKPAAGTTGTLRVFLDTFPAGLYGGFDGGSAGYSLPEIDTATLTPGVWQTLNWEFTTTTNVSNEPGRCGFWVRTWSAGGNRDVYLDNFAITAVPEPTVMGLVGLVGLACLRRHHAA